MVHWETNLWEYDPPSSRDVISLIHMPNDVIRDRFCGPTITKLCFSLSEITMGLRDVRVSVPAAVKRGDSVNLICNYNLENDTLYTIKWYKGKREFYRYTPKENPAARTFPSSVGMLVDVSISSGV